MSVSLHLDGKAVFVRRRCLSLSVFLMNIMSAATCTLAVVMFRTLGRVDIPGGLPHSDAVRDKATYREIYHAARTMEEQCVEQGTHPANVGWAVVGKCHQVVERGVTDCCKARKGVSECSCGRRIRRQTIMFPWDRS